MMLVGQVGHRVQCSGQKVSTAWPSSAQGARQCQGTWSFVHEQHMTLFPKPPLAPGMPFTKTIWGLLSQLGTSVTLGVLGKELG